MFKAVWMKDDLVPPVGAIMHTMIATDHYIQQSDPVRNPPVNRKCVPTHTCDAKHKDIASAIAEVVAHAGDRSTEAPHRTEADVMTIEGYTTGGALQLQPDL
jgi:hypothetical protein